MTIYEILLSIVGSPTTEEAQVILYVIACSFCIFGIKCIYNLIFHGLFNIK